MDMNTIMSVKMRYKCCCCFYYYYR